MPIISISGKIGAGKDTVASIIMESSPTRPWEVKKWAGKLKEVASLITGIPIEKFEDQEFKKTHLGPEWNNPTTSEPLTVREFLQLLGTNAIRDSVHINTWVNALMSDYKTSNGVITQTNDELDSVTAEKFWIITDTRFPNELEAVQKNDGIVINVIRDSGNVVGATHLSETSLDSFTNWDYVIVNDGTIEDLRRKVFNILRRERLVRRSSLD